MNSYNPSGNKGVVVFLLIISVLLAGFIHTGLNAINEYRWLISVPSVAGIYQILYYMFDRYIWKWSLLRKIDLVTVPDLNGKWRGQLTSSHKSDRHAYPISVIITQRWSKILIRLEAEKSHSRSIAANFLTDDPSSPELVYVYDNDPKAIVSESMHAHSGTARLRLIDSILQGKYYTGQDRKTVGDIELERV